MSLQDNHGERSQMAKQEKSQKSTEGSVEQKLPTENKPEEKTESAESKIPQATTGEVLRYLRESDYHFSASEKETNIIAIKKDRGEGLKYRRVVKGNREEIETEKQYLADYDKLAAAFNGFVWFRKKREGAGRSETPYAEYVSELQKSGIKSSTAGILNVNVAKLYKLAREEFVNRAGENVNGYEQVGFRVAWDEGTQELRITRDKRQK